VLSLVNEFGEVGHRNNELGGVPPATTMVEASVRLAFRCSINGELQQRRFRRVLERPDPPEFHRWWRHTDWRFRYRGPTFMAGEFFAICSVWIRSSTLIDAEHCEGAFC